MEDKKEKGLKLRVLDENVCKSLKTTVEIQSLERYFGRKDGEAFGIVTVLKEGRVESVVFLARTKYVSRVTKFIVANNISKNPVVMSREQANKTFAKALGIKFDVFEVKQ